MTMGLQGDLVQPEPCVSLRISIALTDGSSPSFSELFFCEMNPYVLDRGGHIPIAGYPSKFSDSIVNLIL